MPLHRAALRSLAALSIVACTDATGVDPIDTTVRELTVNSNTPAYVALTEGPTALTPADPVASDAWDLTLSATTVATNREAGIAVHCLCYNAAMSNATLATFTAANQLPFFDAVTDAQIPADSAFHADAFAPALTGWTVGTGAAAVADTDRLLLLKRGTTTVTFVKARVKLVTGAASAGPASIDIELAEQTAAGAAFGTARTITLAQGAKHHVATQGAGTATEWDLFLDGWSLRLNSGASGTGSTSGVGFAMPFASLDVATAASMPPSTFRRDGYASVFGTSAWYRYNISGTDNQIWPTYNVYLVKRDDAVFKVQLTGYYDITGAPRNITIRAARIR